MDKDYMKMAITNALKDLASAAKELTADTQPRVPEPRPRFFFLIEHRDRGKSVVWPAVADERVRFDSLMWGYALYELYYERFPEWIYDLHYYERLALWILDRCEYQPSRVLKVVRRIQAAAAWCRARAEGRRRAAREILRQQIRAVEALKAEITAAELAR